jgi:3D (Asp-Asp-Asp) domain-containing protein
MTDPKDERHAPTWIDAIAAAAHAGGGFFSDLFARILNGLKGLGALAPLVLGLGCQTDPVAPATVPTATPAVAAATVTHPAAAAAQLDAAVSPDRPHVPDGADTPRALGTFHITFYYVIGEDEVAVKRPVVAANDNVAVGSDSAAEPVSGAGEAELASVLPPSQVTLYKSAGCEPIARVSREFASEIELQGTGKLRDGRVLNIWGSCGCGHSPCFAVTGTQWGTAGSGNPLSPFRTVAVDPKVIKVGSLLYIPALEGRRMPGHEPWGGFVHDGCVVADDTGGGIDGNQLDLFVGRKAYYLGLANQAGSHGWAKHTEIYDGAGKCERKGRVVSRIPAAI